MALFFSGIRPTHQHTPRSLFTVPHWFSHPGNLWTRKQSCPYPGDWLQSLKVRSTMVRYGTFGIAPPPHQKETFQNPGASFHSQESACQISLNLILQVGCRGSIVEGDPVSEARTSCAFLRWPFHIQGSRLNFYIGSTGTPNFFIKVHQHLIWVHSIFHCTFWRRDNTF